MSEVGREEEVGGVECMLKLTSGPILGFTKILLAFSRFS